MRDSGGQRITGVIPTEYESVEYESVEYGLRTSVRPLRAPAVHCRGGLLQPLATVWYKSLSAGLHPIQGRGVRQASLCAAISHVTVMGEPGDPSGFCGENVYVTFEKVIWTSSTTPSSGAVWWKLTIEQLLSVYVWKAAGDLPPVCTKLKAAGFG